MMLYSVTSIDLLVVMVILLSYLVKLLLLVDRTR